jgi:cell division protein FtsQ
MQISLPFESVKASAKKNSYRKKRRQTRRRLLWALKFVLLCLAFAALSILCVMGYHSLLSSPLLQVTTVQVKGCQQLDPQTVIQQAGIPSGVNILSLDLNNVSQRLTSHPWIATALIGREIPDRIRIEIKERQPVALVQGSQFYLMDPQGVCFARAVPGEHPGLPIITGLNLETLGAGCGLPRQFAALIEDLHRECHLKLPWRLISEIRWNEHAGLTVFMVRGGIQVDLGSSSYGPKIARMKRVLRYLEERGIHNQLRGIDLSLGNRVFVRGNFRILKRERHQQRGV